MTAQILRLFVSTRDIQKALSNQSEHKSSDYESLLPMPSKL